MNELEYLDTIHAIIAQKEETLRLHQRSLEAHFRDEIPRIEREIMALRIAAGATELPKNTTIGEATSGAVTVNLPAISPAQREALERAINQGADGAPPKEEKP